MKQSAKNEIDVLNLITKLQEQLALLDKKLDILVQRSTSETKIIPKPILNTAPSPAKPNDAHKGRQRYQAICADCKKECTIPFKPSGDRPVYCQDCFSRRKVISMSGIKLAHKPPEAAPAPTAVTKTTDIQKPQAKTKKKAGTVKKPTAKKKPVPKKK
jgi:CxxC-x17-CxxC domain-containing protein